MSPLYGIEIVDLAALVSNKFNPPPPGSDRPHQGVDFSVLDRISGLAVGGNPVQAILGGHVSFVLQDRFPYGYTVVIETQVDSLNPVFLNSFVFPTPAPLQTEHATLTCPEIMSDILTDLWENPEDSVSIYQLYGHLEQTPEFQLGDHIVQGQILGSIGSSGNALNPHLHLEIREGPSGLVVPSMAHYDASASLNEMAFYCVWRISNAFQLLDPMMWLQEIP